MKYKIKFNQTKNNKPYVSIEEDGFYWHLNELNSCDTNYIIDDVLPNLLKVMSGDMAEYEFGYDATIVDFYKDKSVINYNFFKDKIEVPSEGLYRFMREWGDYLISWKKNKESQA